MIDKKICENKECGKEFYGTKRAKFCSDKCRVTNWRKNMPNVDYILYGENESVLAEGKCKARRGEYELLDICGHAGVEIDGVWSVETTEIGA